MPKLRVHAYAMSVDGYSAGPDQALETPMGVGGMALHQWVFQTATGRAMIGQTGGSTGLDNDKFHEGFEGIGATIMGRNMFGPVRGEWPDDEWKGWWGPEPPYHHPVFVLTHHPRASFDMEGGTTFHFTDDPIEAVLERAFDAAGGADVRLGGGASTVQQYLRAGLVDDLHLVLVPTLLGGGERLFDHLAGSPVGPGGYELAAFEPSESVVHLHFTRSSPA